MTTRTPEQDRLRDTSGSVTTVDALVAFIYTLLRDHLPAGGVAAAVNDATGHSGPCEYTNGWLAQYAQHIAARLRGVQTPNPDELRTFVRLASQVASAVERDAVTADTRAKAAWLNLHSREVLAAVDPTPATPAPKESCP